MKQRVTKTLTRSKVPRTIIGSLYRLEIRETTRSVSFLLSEQKRNKPAFLRNSSQRISKTVLH